MKKEPLKDKLDTLEFSKDNKLIVEVIPFFHEEDVASAVAWLKQQFKGEDWFTNDEVFSFIDEAFPDIKKD